LLFVLDTKCHGYINLIYEHCVQNSAQPASCRDRLGFGACSSLRGLQIQAGSTAIKTERSKPNQTQCYAVPQATAEQLHKCVIRENTLLNK